MLLLCIGVQCARSCVHRPSVPTPEQSHAVVHSCSNQGSSVLYSRALSFVFPGWGHSWCSGHLVCGAPHCHTSEVDTRSSLASLILVTASEAEEGQEEPDRAGRRKLAPYLPGCHRPDGQAQGHPSPGFPCVHRHGPFFTPLSQGDFCVGCGDRGLLCSSTGQGPVSTLSC